MIDITRTDLICLGELGGGVANSEKLDKNEVSLTREGVIGS